MASSNNNRIFETVSGKHKFHPDRRLDESTDESEVNTNNGENDGGIQLEMLSTTPTDDGEGDTNRIVHNKRLYSRRSAYPPSMDGDLESGEQEVISPTDMSTLSTKKNVTFSKRSDQTNDSDILTQYDGEAAAAAGGLMIQMEKPEKILTDFQVIFYIFSVLLDLIATIILVPTENRVVLTGIIYTISSIGFCFSDAAEIWKQFQYPNAPKDEVEEETIFNAVSTSERFSFKRTRGGSVIVGGLGLGSSSRRNNSAKIDRGWGKSVSLSDDTNDDSSTNNKNNINSGNSLKSWKLKRAFQKSTPEMTSPFLLNMNMADSTRSAHDSEASKHQTKGGGRGEEGEKQPFTAWSLENPVTLARVMAMLSFTGSVMLLIGSIFFIYDRTVMYGVKITIIGAILFLFLSLRRIYESGCHGNKQYLLDNQTAGGSQRDGYRNNSTTNTTNNTDNLESNSSVSAWSTATTGGGGQRQRSNSQSTATSYAPTTPGVSHRSQATTDYFEGDSVLSTNTRTVKNGTTVGGGGDTSNTKEDNSRVFEWKNLWLDWQSVAVDVCVVIGAIFLAIGCIFYFPRFQGDDRAIWAAWICFLICSCFFNTSAVFMAYVWWSCSISSSTDESSCASSSRR